MQLAPGSLGNCYGVDRESLLIHAMCGTKFDATSVPLFSFIVISKGKIGVAKRRKVPEVRWFGIAFGCHICHVKGEFIWLLAAAFAPTVGSLLFLRIDYSTPRRQENIFVLKLTEKEEKRENKN